MKDKYRASVELSALYRITKFQGPDTLYQLQLLFIKLGMRKSTPLSLNACSKSIMKNMEYCIQNN